MVLNEKINIIVTTYFKFHIFLEVSKLMIFETLVERTQYLKLGNKRFVAVNDIIFLFLFLNYDLS